MVGVDGQEMEENGGAGGRRAEGERLPGRREGDDAEQGEVEAWESGGEERGGGAGAEEGSVGPERGEAASVIGVHMSQEVGLTPTLPPVHRYQSALHLFAPLSVSLSNRASFLFIIHSVLFNGLTYYIKAHYDCFIIASGSGRNRMEKVTNPEASAGGKKRRLEEDEVGCSHVANGDQSFSLRE